MGCGKVRGRGAALNVCGVSKFWTGGMKESGYFFGRLFLQFLCEVILFWSSYLAQRIFSNWII